MVIILIKKINTDKTIKFLDNDFCNKRIGILYTDKTLNIWFETVLIIFGGGNSGASINCLGIKSEQFLHFIPINYSAIFKTETLLGRVSAIYIFLV